MSLHPTPSTLADFQTLCSRTETRIFFVPTDISPAPKVVLGDTVGLNKWLLKERVAAGFLRRLPIHEFIRNFPHRFFRSRILPSTQPRLLSLPLSLPAPPISTFSRPYHLSSSPSSPTVQASGALKPEKGN